MKKLILAALSLCALVSCAENKEQKTTTVAEDLITRLENITAKNLLIFGHQDDMVYGHTWKYEDGRSDVKDMVGEYPALAGWEIADIELDSTVSIDKVPFDVMRKEIIAHHKRGGINTISWHCNNPVSGGNSWDFMPGVVAASIEGGKQHAKMQTYLQKVADFLLTLKDENGELIPIIFRPWHEHTGNWFWWGQDMCTTEEYKALWDMTYTYFAERGLSNLAWAYSPSVSGGTEKYAERMPALDQFDIFGLDSYQYSTNEQYIEVAQTSLKHAAELAKEHGKLLALTETGYEGVKYDKWWTEVLMPAMEGLPVSYVMVWRNAWDKPEHFFCAFKGHSSEADFVKFYNLPQVAFLNEIKNL